MAVADRLDPRIVFFDPMCPAPYSRATLDARALGGSEASAVRVAEALDAVVMQHCRHYAEGRYTIDRRNPKSKFHLSLHISYPNAADRARAAELGVHPGGDIMIHGQQDGQPREHDWTQGCIAVTDAEMDEIWSLVPEGTPIVINP